MAVSGGISRVSQMKYEFEIHKVGLRVVSQCLIATHVWYARELATTVQKATQFFQKKLNNIQQHRITLGHMLNETNGIHEYTFQ